MMCGCGVRWIWRSIKKRLSMPSMKVMRKSPSLRCRRCNGLTIKTLQDAPRDLEQAKKLLARAGYPNGFTLSLWATPVERPYNPNPRLMAQMIQADWEKIGLTAKIVFYEWGEYL